MSAVMREGAVMRGGLGRWLVVCAVVLGALVSASPAEAQRRRRRDRDDDGEAAASAGESRATIVLRDGRRFEDVELSSVAFEKVEYRERSSRRTDDVDGDEILEIDFLTPPPTYTQGRSQIRAGLYERASRSFTEALGALPEGSVMWPFVAYWLGEAQRLAGNHADAVGQLESLLGAHGEHYIAAAAIHSLGYAQVGAGMASDALGTFQRLDSAYGEYWGVMGKLGEGEAHLANGRPSDARGAFQIADSRAGFRMPDLQRAAQVGVGKCFVADERYDDAIRHFEGILARPGLAPEVAGGAWVGKADCYLAKAESGRDGDPTELRQQALIAYLTCATRYAGVPGSYPKALYQASRLLGELGQESQAEALASELRERCPDSEWTERLR